jgi:hypothetical protein
MNAGRKGREEGKSSNSILSQNLNLSPSRPISLSTVLTMSYLPRKKKKRKAKKRLASPAQSLAHTGSVDCIDCTVVDASHPIHNQVM